jgi:hypothetical protein
MSTFKTEWGVDTISVSADWGQASCPITGDLDGFQVADFQHRPERALRRALEQCAQAEGASLDDPDTQAAIDAALADAVEVEDE